MQKIREYRPKIKLKNILRTRVTLDGNSFTIIMIHKIGFPGTVYRSQIGGAKQKFGIKIKEITKMETISTGIDQLLEKITSKETTSETLEAPKCSKSSTLEKQSDSFVKDLPFLYVEKDFDTYDENKLAKEDQKNYDACKNFNTLGKKSLVLFGNVGTGKTHLAISIAKRLPMVNYHEKSGMTEYVKKRKSKSLFLVADEFYQNLNDTIQLKKSKLELINEYLSFDLLIFDDLSSQNFTPAKGENLYLLINRAYLDSKRIIITTNFTPERLKELDERITSRLKEMANFLVFTGKDYRK